MGYLKNFNYQISGAEQRPQLVFLHGLLGSGHNWRRVVTHFSSDFHILTYDQRGHGRSFQPQEGYSPEDFADDLLKILDELNWKKIHLVGHSMGGRNALNFAARFPERVTKLVIEDIAPDLNPEANHRIRRMLELIPTPFESKAEAKIFFEEKLPHLLKTENPRTLANYLYTNIVEKDSGKADWRFFKEGVLKAMEEGRSKERWEEVQKLSCPTLVIRGETSQELSVKSFERMQQLNPLVRGVEIKRAGHWVHFDQLKEFNHCLELFFQQ